MPVLPRPGTPIESLKCPLCGKQTTEPCEKEDCPQKPKKEE